MTEKIVARNRARKQAFKFGCLGIIPVMTAWLSLYAGDFESQTLNETVATETVATAAVVDAAHDRSKFMGARACLECHRSEYVSWLSTEHFNNSVNRFDITKDTIAKRYLALHGSLDRCYQCHSAPPEKRFGRAMVESGTSCESCHGASGGEDGWLNRHAVYGPNITSREQETEQHYQDRVAFCDNAGMIRPAHQMAVATNCIECHIITDPELVGEAVGHPVRFDDFILLPYLNGEVRHNFHTNQKKNAEAPTLDTLRRDVSPIERQRVYLIVEQLGLMKVALQGLVDLPSDEAFEESYADEIFSVFEDGADFLEEYVDVLLDPDEDDIEPLEEESVEFLLGVVEEFERFDDLDTPSREEAAQSLKVVEAAAEMFMKQFGDGKKLAALDIFFEDFGDPVGEVLQP